MASPQLSNYFSKVVTKDEIKSKSGDINYLLNKFCFFAENDEVVFDFRFYKALINNYQTDQVLNHTVAIFQELQQRQQISGKIHNVLHLNLEHINIVKIEKYMPTLKPFMQQLMLKFPTYDLTRCYAYNASIIFTVIKQLAVTIYGDKTMKTKIIIVKDLDDGN